MKRAQHLAYWLVLGVPTLCYLIVATIEGFGLCSLNPYAGFTCAAPLAYLLAPATLGLLTLVPFIAIGTIWIIFAWAIKRAARR